MLAALQSRVLSVHNKCCQQRVFQVLHIPLRPAVGEISTASVFRAQGIVLPHKPVNRYISIESTSYVLLTKGVPPAR